MWDIKEMTIGTGSMQELGMKIDFKEMLIQFNYEGKVISTPFENMNNACIALSCNLNLTIHTIDKINQTESQIDLATKVDEITTINREQKDNLLKLVTKYHDIFSQNPGCCKTYKHKIEV